MSGATEDGVAAEPGPLPVSQRIRMSREADVVMAAARYERYEGIYPALPFLGLYLCLGGGGRLVRQSAAQSLDGPFVPGRVGLGAPDAGGTGYGPSLDLLALGIAPGRLASLGAELPGGALDIEAAASTFHDDPLLAAAIEAMWRESEEHALSTAFFDHALAVTIHRVAAGVPRPAATGSHRLGARQMRRLVDFIEAHLDTDVTVAQLARLVDLSPNHFSRCFRATTGLPPFAFLTRRRLERAARLLTETSLTVTEIAALSGYANPSQFAAAFRRHRGLSPQVWRWRG